MHPEFPELLLNIAHSRKFHELGSGDQIRQHPCPTLGFEEAGGVSDLQGRPPKDHRTPRPALACWTKDSAPATFECT